MSETVHRNKGLLIKLFRCNGTYIPYIQWITLLLTIGAVYGTFTGMFNANWWWVVALMHFCICSLGVVITYHRCLAHRSFAMAKPLERLFSLFGALSGTGSGLAWAAQHRMHHRFSDKPEKDPHYPRGWKMRFATPPEKANKWEVRDIIQDKFHVFVHNYYYGLLALWGIGLFLIQPELALFGFIIPMSLLMWVTTAASWAVHRSKDNTFADLGYRNFNTDDESVNSPWFAMLTWGEGWHNNHHAEPEKWNKQVKWWELDPSGWIIYFLRKTTDNQPTAYG